MQEAKAEENKIIEAKMKEFIESSFEDPKSLKTDDFKLKDKKCESNYLKNINNFK